MKKIFYILAFMLAVTCITANAQDNCIIKGTITGAQDGYTKLYSNTNVIMDSVSMVNGKFEIKTKIELPQYALLYVHDKQDSILKIVNVFLENREISMTGKADIREKTEFENAPMHNEAIEYAAYLKGLDATKKAAVISRLSSDAFKIGDKAKVNELEKEQFVYYRELIDKVFAFKENSSKSPVAAYFVLNYVTRLSLEDQIKTDERFSKELTNSFYRNKLQENIKAEQRVVLGNVAPDFKAKDLAGKEYNKASFAGKYIFLEFSASWCGWCKKEIPFVRSAYNALKDKNIVFITMNMDTTREKWEGDVVKENIEWLCISNLEGINSDLAKSYNVHGIPACFVIDPDGKIIKRDIRGNEVLDYLSSLVR